jgi:PAS domain S-box-containing protein
MGRKKCAIRRLQRTICLLIVATLIIQFFTSVIFAAQDTPALSNKLNKVSIAYCVDCVPFHFQDKQGKPAGILIDLWRLWSEKTGIKVDFLVAPWDDSLTMVGSGVADAHAGLFFNNERDKFLDYAAALRKTDTHVFIHKALPSISNFKDLSAYRIAVLAKDYVERYLKERLPGATIVPYPNYADIMSALREGTIRVFAADTPSGIYHLQRSGIFENFSFSKDLLLYQNDWFAAAQKGNTSLVKIINTGMARISPTEKTEIGRRWSGTTKEEKADALLISMDRAYPPMTFLNAQGSPAGFLVDLWRLWSEKTGRQIRFREDSLKESLEALRNGEADVHAGIFRNDEREQWLDFSSEVYQIKTGLYHQVGTSVPDDLTQLKEKTLGVIAGSYQEAMAQTRWPDLRLTPFDTVQELIQTLLKKKAVAVLAEVPVMNVLLDQMGSRGEITLKSDQIFLNSVHPAVLKERKEIMASIEQGFVRISRKELEVLEKRWVVNPKNRIYSSKFQFDRNAVPLDLTPREKKWLKAHPVIRMGVDRSWPPFEYLDDLSRHTGIAADFLQLIETRLGIRFSPPPNISWEEVIAKTKQGELDILSVLTPTRERENFLNFTDPYIQAPLVIVRRTGSSSVNELNDLSGQKVGVVSGYAAEDRLRQDAPYLELVPAKDFEQGLLALSTGSTDAFVGNLPSVNHFIQELFLSNLEVGASAGFTLDLAIGVRKDWQVLTEILNKAVRSVTKEERRKIFRSVSIETVKEQENGIGLLRIVVGVVLLTLLLTLIVFMLNRYMKTARAEHTLEDIFQSSKIRGMGIGIIGLFLAMTIILAWVAINHIDQRVRRDTRDTLSIVLSSTQDSLHLWAESEKSALNQLLIAPELIKSAEALLALPRNKDALVKSSAQVSARTLFNSRLEVSFKGGFFIIAPDFISIGSRRDTNIGTTNLIAQQREDLIKRVFKGEVVFVPPIYSDVSLGGKPGGKNKSDPTMFLVGPLHNDRGKIIAAVSIRLDPFQDFTRLTQGGRIGESGETYAFNRQGYLLTESRFTGHVEQLGLISKGEEEVLTVRVSDPGGNLMTGFQDSQSVNSRPLTLMAQSATAGQAGVDIQGYRDYRGVPVFGAWLWDNNLGLGLASEIDQKEALEPFYSVRNIIILILSIVVFFSLLLTALSAWVGEKANLTLRKARDDLEQRVEERTQELKRSGEELKKSEVKTRSIIDNALDGIITIDESGIIQSGNPILENIFGYQVSEILGKNIKFLMPEPYQSEHDGYLEKYLKTGTTTILGLTRELEGLRKDGTVFPLDLSVSEMFLDDQRYFTGMIRDTSQRKEAEEGLRKLSKAVEQSPAVVVITDTSGAIEYVNPKFMEVTGYTEKDVLGENPRILKSGEESKETYETLWKTISEGKEWHGEFRNKKKNGDLYWESALISPIKTPEGTVTHFLSIKEDITERKKIEGELKLAKLKAEDATKAKGDFLANMSHEIRTPMNAIIGMSHLALKTDLNAKQQNYLNKIQSSSNALLGLINDILDFSKIEAGKLDMESADFQLDKVLDDLSTLVTLKAQDKGLEVLFSIAKDVPYSLVGDSLRLGQILTNLTNNAVKFTEQGEIVVIIKCLKEENEKVELEFSVKDTGIGLTEKQIGKLFQSFSQADTSTSRKFGGTGLGLTISKKLVEMMNGKIWVESESGKGSSFIFTGIFRVSREQKKKRVITSDDLRGKRVLIVDDNQAAREILEDALQSFSMEVEMASSGAEGITKVEKADTKTPFDLVIMDWQMPEMNGIRASEIIKKHQKLKKIPKIIMLTAFGREEVARKAEEAHLDGFMVKPMNPSVLFETIGEVFGGIVSKDKFGEKPSAEQEIEGLDKIKNAKVLLVDDNEINQEVANEILEQAGFSVTIAINGQEAVDMVLETEFDCVLMDIQMPVMDGYDASRAIRKDNRFASLPIIAMTANAMQGDREKCINAGMNDHVAKPINPKQLFSALIQWISVREGLGQSEISSPKTTPTSTEESILPELPGIDVTSGLARINGNEKLYRKLLSNFYQCNKNTKLEIEKALKEGDTNLAERLVHTVKGVASTIGADELAKVSQPLETELRNGNKTIDDNLWNDFWGNLERILSTVKQLEPEDDKGSAEELDLTKIKLSQSLIDSMREDINSGMLMELEQHFPQIEVIEPDGKKLVEHLKELADNFDDEGILKIVDLIEKS